MGRLINYGVGERVDRLSILGLKILFGSEAGKDVTHFERERAVLLTQARASTQGDWGTVLELAAVNAALWHAEDELRGMRKLVGTLDTEGLEAVLSLAFRIQSLNDRRAELVGTLNAEAGDVSKEKLT